MNKPVAIGLIIFFILLITGGVLWLTFKKSDDGGSAISRILFPSSGQRDVGVSPEPSFEIKEDNRLVQLFASAVSGFSVKDSGVRFVERATGHIFDIESDGKNLTRISNTTIPQIFDVRWSLDTEKALLRYREGENIRLASAVFAGTSTEGVLLPSDVVSFDYAPDRDRIVYIIETANSQVVFAANPDNSKQTEMLRLPSSDFMIEWPDASFLSFLSRPSGEVEGFLYKYDINKGSFDKVIGPAFGLNAKWSAAGSGVLYSDYDAKNKRTRVFVYDVADKKATDLSIQSFVQKCVWPEGVYVYCAVPSSVPGALYPDLWLTGETGFDDHLWQINISTLQKKDLADLQDIDVGALDISSDLKFIYLQNKKDGSLWSFRLDE